MITDTELPTDLHSIANKISTGQRINDKEGLLLFEKASLGFVGSLANEIRQKKNGKKKRGVEFF